VYACLLSANSPLSSVPEDASKNDPETYYLSESHYITFRNRILDIEGQILNAVGFDVHVSLPHPLAVTYLQALDIFGSSQPRGTGHLVTKRAIEYLNTALVSPQMLYLTHQPNALATAAIYLAARDIGAKLPNHEWWEVFDTDREDLGFLALSMRSLESWVKAEVLNWGAKAVITRSDIGEVLSKKGNGANHETEDEEAEMMKMMDEKVS
jgi:cyclin L